MIVDSSVLVAIVLNEDDAERLSRSLGATIGPKMSAVNFAEAAIRIDGFKNSNVTRIFDELVAQSGMTIVPATVEHARLAREAYKQFGKGYHGTRLNFGDCFAYALAKETGEPLLFKGDDFRQTDIPSAL